MHAHMHAHTHARTHTRTHAHTHAHNIHPGNDDASDLIADFLVTIQILQPWLLLPWWVKKHNIVAQAEFTPAQVGGTSCCMVNMLIHAQTKLRVYTVVMGVAKWEGLHCHNDENIHVTFVMLQ